MTTVKSPEKFFENEMSVATDNAELNQTWQEIKTQVGTIHQPEWARGSPPPVSQERNMRGDWFLIGRTKKRNSSCSLMRCVIGGSLRNGAGQSVVIESQRKSYRTAR